jgi:hypothetical protein
MPPTMLLMGTALAMALFDANGAVLLFLSQQSEALRA